MSNLVYKNNYEDLNRQHYKLTKMINNTYTLLCFFIFFLTWSNYIFYNLFSNTVSIILLALNSVIVLFNSPIILVKNRNEFFYLMFLLIIVMINAIFSSSGIGGIIVIANILTMLVFFRYLVISERQLAIISLGMFIYFLFYCFIQAQPFNPNGVGYIIFLTFIYTNFYLNMNRKFKWLIPLCIIIAIYYVYLTESRGALLGVILFVLLCYVIPSKLWRNKVIFSLISFCLTIGAIFFVHLYVYMWRNNVNFKVEFSQKSLYTGRESIWNELIIDFKAHPLVGLGSNYNIMSNASLNVHNSMFNILVIYGIPVFVFFIFLLWNRLGKLSCYVAVNKNVRISVSGFLSILLVGFFETNLIWSNNVFPALFLLAIAYSNSRRKDTGS